MTEVIVMTYYMSGDRNTIASALHLNRHWCVLIVGLDTDPRTEQLEAFFQAKVGADRVRVMSVTSKEEAGSFAGLAKRTSFMREAASGWVPDLEKNARRAGFVRTVADLFKAREVTLSPPGHATATIGDWFGKKPHEVRETLRRFWSDPELAERFTVFLGHLGFHREQRYAFLWCKTGEVGAEKAHHFTDPISWAHLARAIAEHGWMPIVVGDEIGVETRPNLVGFWNEWQKLFDEPLPRDRQLAMWAFIATTWGDRCCSIGMRSGMLEVPALVGIRTLYLEEVANQQRARMAQWLMKVTGWCRAVLPEPPGTAQSAYWLRHMLSHQGEFQLVLKQVDAVARLRRRRHDVLTLIAMVMQRVTGGKVDTQVVEIIAGYVDVDVRLEKYALSLACVRVISEWVAAPKTVYETEEMEDRMLENVLSTGLLAIAGITAARAKALPQPRLKAVVGAEDPWPGVKVGGELTGTREQLAAQGFDAQALATLAPGGSGRFRSVVWKCLCIDEGNKLVLKRQSPVLA